MSIVGVGSGEAETGVREVPVSRDLGVGKGGKGRGALLVIFIGIRVKLGINDVSKASNLSSERTQ